MSEANKKNPPKLVEFLHKHVKVNKVINPIISLLDDSDKNTIVDDVATDPSPCSHSLKSHTTQARSKWPCEAKKKTSHSLPKETIVASCQSHMSVNTLCAPHVLEQG